MEKKKIIKKSRSLPGALLITLSAPLQRSVPAKVLEGLWPGDGIGFSVLVP